jgi:hypothetical protein
MKTISTLASRPLAGQGVIGMILQRLFGLGRTELECYVEGCQAAPLIVVASRGAFQATCCAVHAREWVESPLGEEARSRPQVAFALLHRWAVLTARESAEEQDEGKLPTSPISASGGRQRALPQSAAPVGSTLRA